MPEVPIVPLARAEPSIETEPQEKVEEELVIPSDTLFDTGSASVRPASGESLRAFAVELAPYLATRDGQWTIVGATDGTGPAAANQRLGHARATAVLEVIGSVEGVNSDRFRVESWGETRPAVDEASATDVTEARARNRRVLILPPHPTP